MKFVETHCHLDALKARPLEETLATCRQENIEKIITIAVEPDNLQVVLDLANTYPEIYTTQGIHPHDAKLYDQEVEQTILYNLQNNSEKIVAVGEIGLDYYYDHSPTATQIEVFEKQMSIAAQHDLPVVIHSREADDDMIHILKKFGKQLKRKGVIHSFTSSLELAECALEEDFYLGFNGIITFKNAQNVRDVLKATPRERILLETDAPYLTPVPHRGKENAPYYLPHVAKYMSESLNWDLQELVSQTGHNAHQLFRLPS